MIGHHLFLGHPGVERLRFFSADHALVLAQLLDHVLLERRNDCAQFGFGKSGLAKWGSYLHGEVDLSEP